MIEMEMNRMKRKVLSFAMIAALCLTMLPTAGWAADAPVEYIDFDENGVQITEPRSCDQYSLVTENNTEWNDSGENDGWYVVNGTVEIGSAGDDSAEDGSSDVDVQRVTVGGDVHLILTNNAKLTVNGGISVNAGNSLTVYAQPAENDKTTGSLTVENVEEGNAGIGGDVQQSGGTITINGGEITATGGIGGAGIGGGSKINVSGGTITINGGEITANGGGNGAGIGGGSASSGGIITINGGTIATTGGNLGAGIGSLGAGGTIEINGGDITATGGNLGAGIGGGDNDSGGEITINGGDEIVATGNGGGAGIGGGNGGAGGMIEINGGNITANGQGSSPARGGAGIGDGYHGSGSTIKIHGGEIVATGYSGSAGIGSGFAALASSATVINIDGGIVIATGSDGVSGLLGGAGIGGGGAANSSVAITISGGTVTATGGKGADGIGSGGYSNSSSQASTFSTGDAGHAVIYATAGEGTDTEAIVGLKENNGAWNAIVFVKGENGSEANTGKVYGNVSLANDLTIKSDQSLEIPDGTSLTVPAEKTLKVESGGTLTINGELVVYGELEGYTGDTSKIHQKNQSDTTWHTDATHHWYGCAVSGCSTHQFDKAAHNITDGKCSVCGYVQPVNITEQPADVTVIEGESATFSVAATGGGTLSYQWQQSTDNGSNWTEIPGATSATYTIEKATLDMNDNQYRCVVKNEADSEATSEAVTLTVNKTTEEPDPDEPGIDPDPDEPGDEPSTDPDDPAEDEPSDTPSTPVIPSEPDPEIEVTEPAHGDVEISPSKPEAGETVTITPTPDAGWEVEDVIVTDEDGECVPVRENPDGSWSYEQPKSDVTIEVIFGEVAPEPTVDVSEIFLDVDPDAWYKDAVQFVYDNGLMTGTSATEFAPDVTTTRAMIVSILARLEGVTAADDAGFSDVDDEWFATAVNWAASVGVVNGFEDNTFRPNDAITREQMAAILCNYAAWKGEDVSARAELSRYSDAAEISSWATDVMRWAVAENLISGVTNDTLQPQGAATRAQVAAILQRFLSK